MNAWNWIKAKTGRILMALGAALASVDGFDVTPIKEPLVKLIGQGSVSALMILLFVAGFWRNQHVASKYTALLKAHAELQEAHDALQAKVAGQ